LQRTPLLLQALQLPKEFQRIFSAVIFFENPYDLAANPNTIALYYRAQFFLAPRILHLRTNLENDISQTAAQWFIGTNLEPGQAEQFSDQYQLKLINVCGPFSLFRKD